MALIKYVINQEDFKKLLDAPFDIRDKSILRLFYMTGLRTTELTRIKTSEVDLKSKTIGIIDSKKKLPFTIPIDTQTANMLIEYMATKEPNTWLFPSRRKEGYPLTKEGIGYIIKYYASKIDLPHWSKWCARYFRRRISRYWLMKGGNLLALQELLRHEHASSTFIYCDGIRFKSELRLEYDKIMN